MQEKDPVVNEEISKLIERLKKGTGPDRKLDRAIYLAIDPNARGEAPEYTGRLVAALTIFPDIKPRELCIAALVEREQEN